MVFCEYVVERRKGSSSLFKGRKGSKEERGQVACFKEERGQVACIIILLVKRSISRLSNKSSSARFRI